MRMLRTLLMKFFKFRARFAYLIEEDPKDKISQV